MQRKTKNQGVIENWKIPVLEVTYYVTHLDGIFRSLYTTPVFPGV